MKTFLCAATLALGLLTTTAAIGNSQPVSNVQPSLVLTQAYNDVGIFPSMGSGNVKGDTVGFVYSFAGDYTPGNSMAAQGQVISIAANSVNFDLIGTSFGGNGTTNYALPNLTGAAEIGASGTPGAQSGTSTINFTASQIPGSGVTQPFANTQPSLGLTPLIAAFGTFPSQGNSAGTAAFIGQVAYFAGNFAPSGWMVANGQILSIAQNPVLFDVIGNTYGGNGTTTFALPNLVGSVAVGADSDHVLGSAFGANATTLTTAQLPVGSTPGVPVNNDQPSLALHYIISVGGIFPPEGGGSAFGATFPTIGEVSLFAGDFAPSGWLFADGQLLSIASNTALFSILGTQYGGDGFTDFALPDLSGRTVIGSGGAYTVGEDLGSDTFRLTAANIPAAPAAVPESSTWLLALAGFFMTGAALRRRPAVALMRAPISAGPKPLLP